MVLRSGLVRQRPRDIEMRWWCGCGWGQAWQLLIIGPMICEIGQIFDSMTLNRPQRNLGMLENNQALNRELIYFHVSPEIYRFEAENNRNWDCVPTVTNLDLKAGT